jgi:hypothetical protein
MKLSELIAELKKHEDLEFEGKNCKEEACVFISSIVERDKIIKSLEKCAMLTGYSHKTSNGVTHFDWYLTLKSIIHELKTGKL